MDNRETARYTLEAIKKSGADMGECSVTGGAKTEVYYETGKISMIRTVFSTSVSIKVIKNKKKGSVSLNTCERPLIDKAVSDALEASEHAKPDDAEGIAELIENKEFSRGEEKPDREALYSLMRGFIDDAKRDYPKISFDSISVAHDFSERGYMNTHGVGLTSLSGANEYGAMFMARDGDRVSSFNHFGSIFSETDKPLIEMGMARTILAETEKQIETKTLSGKFEGDLVITPSCLGSFIRYIQYNFLSDAVHIDGTSIWKDSLNKQVAAPIFTLHSNPASPELPGGYFITGDGYAAGNMVIIENGILKNFTLSRYGAAKTGKGRSANYGGSYCVDAGDKSLSEIISSVKRGLLLNRFSGGAPAINGDFTGVAKNSFLIENGRVKDAVSETMVSGNLATLLKNITMISSERVNDGEEILPWVKASGIVISGR